MGASVGGGQILEAAPVTRVHGLALVLVFLGRKQLLLDSWLGGFRNALLRGELLLVAARCFLANQPAPFVALFK